MLNVVGDRDVTSTVKDGSNCLLESVRVEQILILVCKDLSLNEIDLFQTDLNFK